MINSDRWLLPEGIEDILPEETATLESLRSDALRMFASWGYQRVIPPMVEFLDTLLTGSAHDLELETFKVIDQLNGRLMGIRADITPQIARIDAHMHAQSNQPSRICYLGATLRTRGSHLERSRSPLQIGAELYGYAGPEADVEVIRLMLELIALSGLKNLQFDLGHVGIYQGLVNQAGLTPIQEKNLFDILQRKALTELTEMLDECNIDSAMYSMLQALPSLSGCQGVIGQARKVLSHAADDVHLALDTLEQIEAGIYMHFPLLEIHYDLTELRGYHYKTGVVFAAFVSGFGREIARGGRYDEIGKAFGSERSATGFSADLKVLSRLGHTLRDQPEVRSIIAPSEINNSDLQERIRELRANGRVVIEAMPDQSLESNSMGCLEKLVERNGEWHIESIQQ